MATIQTGPWIVRSKPQPHLRLFCFPYAGGGASLFRPWSDKLPSEVEVCPVQLPGRENRLREPAFNRLTPLVQALDQALRPYMDIPYAFFGYSMGALISFELARHSRKTRSPGPLHLFVAAHRAPQLPQAHPELHRLPEPAFIDALEHLGGTPTTVRQHAELMQLMLPMLRADFALCETYAYSPETPLSCPITAFGGEQDTHVGNEALLAWREQAQGPFTLRILAGNHFFVHSQQQILLQAISQDLTKILEDLHPLRESNL
jgi:medium-chain acyl-[acyl-carrier-protein] hydrolase